MFTIEHDFDATVITLVDEGSEHLQEDVTINSFEDCVTVEQFDPQADRVMKVTFSMNQLRELRAALNLPEGIYRLSGGPFPGKPSS
ncbi:MAG: hypothetical protein JJU15_06990 [Pararhodobacter sp.]|nr:hypothetical protein [Pararhodobacter sp.]